MADLPFEPAEKHPCDKIDSPKRSKWSAVGIVIDLPYRGQYADDDMQDKKYNHHEDHRLHAAVSVSLSPFMKVGSYLFRNDTKEGIGEIQLKNKRYKVEGQMSAVIKKSRNKVAKVYVAR